MKSSTENIYKQKVNQVIDYINFNLHQPLQLNVIADIVNMSQRQLLRMMSSALDEPLYSYVARQRVERAVLYMQTEDMSLQNLAGLVGYDNPQSFSKAFKKQFGISPKTYISRLRMRLKECEHDGKECELHSEVYNFEGLNLVYIRIWGKYGEEEPYETVWSKLIHFLKSNDLLLPDTRFIGLSFDDPNVTNPNQCRFYACASVQKEIMPTCEFGTIRLPQGKYAVYTLQGYYTDLQDWYNIINVSQEYSLRHGMSFEEYINYSKENKKREYHKNLHTDKINKSMENSLPKYITLTEDNIDKEHICCAFSDKKCLEGYESKKEWLKKEFANGYVFRRLDARAKVFIEYVPAEYAWLPVTAPNYLMINCFWVSGQYKGQGHGYNLLQFVIEDAKKQQKNGLVTVVGTKKNHFMSDTKWLLQHGFKEIEKLPNGFSLLVMSFHENSAVPYFNDCVKSGECPDKLGIVAYYSNRCPYTDYYVNGVLRVLAQEINIPLKVIKLETREQAQNSPTPATIFSLFYNGKFVTTDLSICTESKFTKLLK